MFFGNLYHLAHSFAELKGDTVHIKVGALKEVTFRMDAIEQCQTSFERQPLEDTPLLGFARKPNVRIALREPVLLKDLFREKKAQIMDCYLKSDELEFLQMRLARRPGAAL